MVADAAQLAQVAADTFALACPPGFDAEAIARHVRLRLSADAFRINLADVGLEHVVAVEGTRAIGYASLATGQQPRLELKQIYVRPEYHGSGLGDELMRVAVQRASDLGYSGVWLGTSKRNARAITFYQRHGFRIAGERVFLVDDVPNDDWILVWDSGDPESGA